MKEEIQVLHCIKFARVRHLVMGSKFGFFLFGRQLNKIKSKNNRRITVLQMRLASIINLLGWETDIVVIIAQMKIVRELERLPSHGFSLRCYFTHDSKFKILYIAVGYLPAYHLHELSGWKFNK